MSSSRLYSAAQEMRGSFQQSSLRRMARHGALDVLSTWDLITGRTKEGLSQPRIHLPYLHAVPAHEEDAFRSFVAELAQDHELIGYSEAVRRIRQGPIDRPAVAFSFDDGFASNVHVAKILEEFGTTGMFFVPPGFIGTPTVAQAREFYGFSEGVDEPAMTWEDLENLKARGHEVGNHTWGHRVMSWVSNDEMHSQISRGVEELRFRLGECDHFAWPRGRFFHFTAAAARVVFATGHISCASAERGAHPRVIAGAPELLCLRRDHIMTEWPLRHCRYFIGRSGWRQDVSYGSWPDGWDVAS